MSKDDVIRRWKSDQPGDTFNGSADSADREAGTALPNPAGEVELDDAELEDVAGGAAGNTVDWCATSAVTCK